MPTTAVQAIPDAVAPVIAAVMQQHPGAEPDVLARLVVHELRDLGWHITAKPTTPRPHRTA
jgi:multidrug efflux pump subunit AcrB